MKYAITISRQANFFFFVANLTAWHFSCQPAYNTVWLKRTGQLTKRERQLLGQFGRLMRKYAFGSPDGHQHYLGYFFQAILEAQTWPALQQQVTRSEYLLIKKVFEAFQKRFNRLWLAEYRRLRQARQVLLAEARHSRTRRIIHDLAILFPRARPRPTLTIVLLMRPAGLPCQVGGGNANLGSEWIVLEAGDLTSRSTCRRKKMRGILYHELVHAQYARPYYEQQLKRFLASQKSSLTHARPTPSPWVWLNEGLVSSLLPQGCLGQKYLGTTLTQNYHRDVVPALRDSGQRSLTIWRTFAAYHLATTLQQYLKQQRPIDRDFFTKLFKLWQKFQKENPETLVTLRDLP